MIGLGTIINSVSIVAAGLVGQFAGKWFKPEQQESLNRACGVSILFIAIAGAMEGMLRIEDGAINSGKSMLVVLCLAVGTVIGERIGIENGFEAFGEWLKAKTGSSGDVGFVNAFVTASLTVSYLSLIGSILIFGIGVNLVWGKKLKVANMLPAVFLAVLAAYLPWSF